MANIKFDRPMLERLKAAYAAALKTDEIEFKFVCGEEHILLLAYAKFLIEYLEERLPA